MKESRKSMIREKLNSRDPILKQKVQNRMFIAVQIQDAMDQKGIQNKDLATKLNKQPSVITKWLSGRHNFTIDTISEIEQALGVKIINKIKEIHELPQ